MIEKIELITKDVKSIDFIFESGKILIDNKAILKDAFKLKFYFTEPIISLRNHDYLWCLPYKNYNASIFTPKLIRLKNNYFVQANLAIGSWRIDMNDHHVLYWCFNQENQNPLTQYKEVANSRNIINVKQDITLSKLSLLFSKNNGMEFSRSQIPFKGVICFTDHCDFDTLTGLQTLRVFFKTYGITTTKGFFLNHFSKREGNASYENNIEELEKWMIDGHEMAYHSLTQSLRSQNDAFKEFEQFSPVLFANTWIDHGYQPYNLSRSHQFKFGYQYTVEQLKSRGVVNYWNYIDSGFATEGVINQLNPHHFTLKRYEQGLQSHSFKKRFGLRIKNLLFHYDGSEKQIENYIKMAKIAKQAIKKRSLKLVWEFMRSLSSISKLCLSVIFNWKSASTAIYPLAKYTPTIFKLDGDSFVFQTLEMTDFVNGLSESNINTLIEESGLCILHTYFSVPLVYHEGRLLENENTINPKVVSNFQYLSYQLKNNEIWNPTFKDLVAYLECFFSLELDIDIKGTIFEVSKTNLIRREV